MGESAPQRYAVVTGSNKGIGFEIVRQLASAGIKVVLTARDEQRGLQALETLKASGLSDFVVFHQLDVADAASVATLAEFVKSQFGKLDILVNNAGISGTVINDKDLATVLISNPGALSEDEKKRAVTQTYELAEECLKINYYGAKITTESLLPLLKLSDSPRIVNVSSSLGKLERIQNESAKKVFGDADNLTEEKVDEVLKKFLEDFKKDRPKPGGAYVISKAAMNAYTRIAAKNFPTISINSVSPGSVITDITANTGILTAEEGAASVVKLALLPNGSPSGQFYYRTEVNNAGIIGTIINDKELFNLAIINRGALSTDNRRKALTQTYELAEECLQTNYYGSKLTAESLLPLLQLSDSPRIVNVSSTLGQLESIPNGCAKSIFIDGDNLTEEKVDKVLKKFLKDFKEGSLDEDSGWPKTLGTYIISKAAMNAYTRILFKK